MFDFEKLEVYQKLRSLNARLLPELFKIQKKEVYLTDQLKRASLSALLNLSEGTGRMSAQDKKQFYIRARASVFESVSILQVLNDTDMIDVNVYRSLYDEYEQISKMILAMIRSLKQ
jgi:four helix bundle protein